MKPVISIWRRDQKSDFKSNNKDVDSCSLKFSLDPKDLLIKTFTMHEGKNEQEIHLLTRW